jgi:hypothetical protein
LPDFFIPAVAALAKKFLAAQTPPKIAVVLFLIKIIPPFFLHF